MITGISTACFYPMLLEDALDAALELGFRELEIFINTDREFEPSFILQLREKIQNAGAQVISVHAFSAAYEDFMFFSTYERRNEDNLRKYGQYFSAAQALGARYFTFHGKRSRGMTGMASEIPEKELICRAMRRLCRVAADNGICLSQENVAWCHSSSPAYLQMLRDEVPELRFTLDVKQAWRAKVPVECYIDIMGDRLVNLHLNDAGETESCCLPFRGMVDFSDMLHRLKRASYEGPFILEVYSRNFKDVRELVTAAERFDRLLATCGREKGNI